MTCEWSNSAENAQRVALHRHNSLMADFMRRSNLEEITFPGDQVDIPIRVPGVAFRAAFDCRAPNVLDQTIQVGVEPDVVRTWTRIMATLDRPGTTRAGKVADSPITEKWTLYGCAGRNFARRSTEDQTGLDAKVAELKQNAVRVREWRTSAQMIRENCFPVELDEFGGIG